MFLIIQSDYFPDLLDGLFSWFLRGNETNCMVNKFLLLATLCISRSEFITYWSGHHLIDKKTGLEGDVLKRGFLVILTSQPTCRWYGRRSQAHAYPVLLLFGSDFCRIWPVCQPYFAKILESHCMIFCVAMLENWMMVILGSEQFLCHLTGGLWRYLTVNVYVRGCFDG